MDHLSTTVDIRPSGASDRPLSPKALERKARKDALAVIANRPYNGEISGVALDFLKAKYAKMPVLELVLALAEMHSGKITKNMVIGKAHRLGLRRKRAK